MKKYAVLIIILTAAALFRIIPALYSPFWFDEAFTFEVGLLPSFNAVIHQVSSNEFNPPAVFIQSHILSLFSHSEFFHRLPALIFSLMGIAAVYFFCSGMDRDTQLYAACLSAFSPLMISLGAEARAYSCFFFLTILSAALYLHQPEKKKLLGILFAAGMYTHYFFAFSILTIVMHSIYIKKLKNVLFSCMVAGALFLPGFYLAFIQMQSYWPSIPPTIDINLLVSSVLGFFIYPFTRNYSIFFEVLLILLFLSNGFRQNNKQIAFCRFSALSIVIFYIIALKTRTLSSRYIVFAAPFFYIAAAEGIRKITGLLNVSRPVTMGLLCSVVIIFNGFELSMNPHRIEYEEAVAYIEFMGNSEPVLVSLLDRAIITKYFARKLGAAQVYKTVLPADKKNIAHIPEYETFWLILTPLGEFPQQKNTLSLIEKTHSPVLERYRAGLKIVKYRRNP